MGLRGVEKAILIIILFLVLMSSSSCMISADDRNEQPRLATSNGINGGGGGGGDDILSLDSIRKTLIELEDTIIFNLIQRTSFPLNSPAFQHSQASFAEFFVRGIEAVQSKGGRYQSPEEVPFFPVGLPPPSVPPRNCSQKLPHAAASVTVTKNIWDFYFNQFLPLLAPKGDDGNYALSLSADIACLQALSRRIHYGKYVAESKFINNTEGYSTAIRAHDTDTLTKLLTDTKVEDMVKQRVAKKATVFGQDVTLGDTSTTNNGTKFKVDPALATRLYDEWVIPLTKDVEIEYLLKRLD